MARHTWCKTGQIGHSNAHQGLDSAETVNFEDIPTRLIDVGASGSPCLKMVVTADNNGALMKNVSEAGFVALSYCWGGDQPAKLLEANVEKHKCSIDPAKLPQTVRDAVWVARTIGFRYLWIDSLCILQDDLDGQGNNPDKATEITRMASYYGCATITLCAASAERAVDDFLEPRKEPSFACGPIRIQLVSKDTMQLIGRVCLGKEPSLYPAEPTTTRGWTLQESLLS